jgi:MFS family permease
MNQITLDKRPAARLHHRWSQYRLPTVLLLQYTVFGLVIGVQGVVWGDIKAALDLGEGVFGSVMMATPLIGCMTLIAAGRLQRFRERQRALAGLLGITVAVLTLATTRDLPSFLVSRMLTGLGFALLDSAVNNAALDWEQATGRRLVDQLYALLTGGVVVGALVGGSLQAHGWSYHEVLLVLLPGLLGVTAISVRTMYATRTGVVPDAPFRSPFEVLRSRSGRTLLGLALVAVAGEAIADLWGAVYLRERGGDAFVGGVTFALFHSALILGRLATGAVLNQWGARAIVGWAGVGVASSAVLLSTGDTLFSVGAFGLLGLGIAGVIPTVLSLARERPAVERVSLVNGVVGTSYLGFVVTPPAVGWLAEGAGLQPALLLVLVALLVALAGLARSVEPGEV